jgi:hypothetical protein
MFEKVSPIIEHDAITASGETRKSSHQKHYGNEQDTRKNPHAIAVGFGQDTPARPWYITWMATCGMLL